MGSGERPRRIIRESTFTIIQRKSPRFLKIVVDRVENDGQTVSSSGSCSLPTRMLPPFPVDFFSSRMHTSAKTSPLAKLQLSMSPSSLSDLHRKADERQRLLSLVDLNTAASRDSCFDSTGDENP
ncbi:unnamed protein product [Dibothriocephalus latus]|uniref:Uncharacterized protein n=1 Tax=Dibothriocephalus latus TaxID=60516 RepID=A0A3P7MH02_DIBLA|nr:unnamed protein product [Dibothriocephalus latus]